MVSKSKHLEWLKSGVRSQMNRDKRWCKCVGVGEISDQPRSLAGLLAECYCLAIFWLLTFTSLNLELGWAGVILGWHGHTRTGGEGEGGVSIPGVDVNCSALCPGAHSSHASLTLTIRTFLLRRGILLLWVLQFGGGEHSSLGQVCQLFVSPKKLQHRRKTFNYWQFAPSRRKGWGELQLLFPEVYFFLGFSSARSRCGAQGGCLQVWC